MACVPFSRFHRFPPYLPVQAGAQREFGNSTTVVTGPVSPMCHLIAPELTESQMIWERKTINRVAEQFVSFGRGQT